MREVIIAKNDAGQRLDKFLHKYFKGAMPSSLLYKYIRKKRIKLNGARAQQDDFLQEGDLLQLYINDEFFAPAPEFVYVKPSFGVVYEDENILLMDKKAGLVVHDDDNGTVNTLARQMLSYLKDCGAYRPEDENSFTPALCNRIDRNTSGIVIAAKNAEALRAMNSIIKQRQVKKTYLALVEGVPSPAWATLEGYLFKDSKQKKVYITPTPQKGALKAVTKYRVKKVLDNRALLEVELITGRTHQIRAHMASIGHPLVGDGKYGVTGKAGTHQALHAYKLEFLTGFEDTPLAYLSGKSFCSSNIPFLK